MTAKPTAKSAATKGPKAEKVKGRGRRPPAREPRVFRHRLVWNGVTLAIRYEPKSICSDDHSHLELKVVRPKDIPLPITMTGYWSYFLPQGEVEEGGGPECYLCRLLDQEAGSPAYLRALARWRQLDLF